MVQTHRDVIAAAKAMGRLVATVEGSVRLQPHVLEAATPRTSACNPTRWRLQPYVLEAATPCAGGCNPSPNPDQVSASLASLERHLDISLDSLELAEPAPPAAGGGGGGGAEGGGAEGDAMSREYKRYAEAAAAAEAEAEAEAGRSSSVPSGRGPLSLRRGASARTSSGSPALVRGTSARTPHALGAAGGGVHAQAAYIVSSK